MSSVKLIAKIILLLVGIPCFLIAISTIYVFIVLNNSVQYIPLFEQKVQQSANSQFVDNKLEIGTVKLGAKGVSKFIVYLHDCTFRDPQGKPIIEVPRASVTVAAWPLLYGKLKINKVSIEDLEITIDKRQIYSERYQNRMALARNSDTTKGLSSQNEQISEHTATAPKETTGIITQLLPASTATEKTSGAIFNKELIGQELEELFEWIEKYRGYIEVISLQEILLNIITINYQGIVESNKVLLSTDDFILLDTAAEKQNLLQLSLKNGKIVLVDSAIEELLKLKTHFEVLERSSLNRSKKFASNHLPYFSQQKNIFNFIEASKIVHFDLQCSYAKDIDLTCKLNFNNIDSAFLSDLVNGSNQDFEYMLDNMKTNLSGNIIIKHPFTQELPNLYVNLSSPNGFLKDQRLSTKMLPFTFQRLHILLSLENNLELIKLQEFSALLLGQIPFHLSLEKMGNSRALNIQMEQIDLHYLELLWPDFLPGAEIKQWIVEHLLDGEIATATAQINILGDEINDLTAKIHFKNAYLDYGLGMPPISELSGIANFTKQGMHIAIQHGKVLKSEITAGSIAIPNFKRMVGQEYVPELKISADFKGKGVDILEHIHMLPSKTNSNIWELIDAPVEGSIKLALFLGAEETDYMRQSMAIEGKIKITTSDNIFFAKDSVVNLRVIKPYREEIRLIADLTKAEIDYLFLQKPIDKPQLIELSIASDELSEITILGGITAKGVFNGLGAISYKNDQGKITIQSIDLDNLSYQQNDFSIKFIHEENLLNISGRSIDLPMLSKFVKNIIRSNSTNLVKRSPLKSLKTAKADISESSQNSTIDSKSKVSSTQHGLNLQLVLDKVWLNSEKFLTNVQIKCYQKYNTWHDFSAVAYFEDSYINIVPYPKKQARHPNALTYKAYFHNIQPILDILRMNSTIQNLGDVILRGEIFRNKQGEIVTEGNLEIKDGFGVLQKQDDDSKILVEGGDLEAIHNRFDITNENVKVIRKAKTKYKFSNMLLTISEGLLYYKRSGVTVAGTYNLRNNYFNFQGSLIPEYFINTLFSLQKIPIVGNIISFIKGGKNNGMFALKYSYIYNASMTNPVLKIYYLESLTPGFIRELLNSLRNNDQEP